MACFRACFYFKPAYLVTVYTIRSLRKLKDVSRETHSSLKYLRCFCSILKWLFEKWNGGGAWTGSIWLRIGTGGGLL
jgi:hypothetical protein